MAILKTGKVKRLIWIELSRICTLNKLLVFMDQLEIPEEELWNSRREWFENELESAQHPMASYLVCDHATALLVDLMSCFCAGAYLAVVILSISIIDAQLRDTGRGDRVTGTAELLRGNFI